MADIVSGTAILPAAIGDFCRRCATLAKCGDFHHKIERKSDFKMQNQPKNTLQKKFFEKIRAIIKIENGILEVPKIKAPKEIQKLLILPVEYLKMSS